MRFSSKKHIFSAVLCLFFLIFLTGCVERKLTINTEPSGALVMLNDEEIGISPVTVNFQWYGDYKVRIQKEGFETIDTHRNLKAPLHDAAGLDLLATIWPERREDHYTWTFELNPYVPPSRDELIKNARDLQRRAEAR